MLVAGMHRMSRWYCKAHSNAVVLWSTLMIAVGALSMVACGSAIWLTDTSAEADGATA